MRKTSLAVAAVTASVTFAPVAAYAAWTSGGTGSGSATATTVNRAAAPMVTRGSGAAVLSWDPTTLANGTPVAGYDVVRHVGTTTTTVCTYTTARSCTDTNPVAGAAGYGVVARIGTNWRGAESATTPFTYDNTGPVSSMTTTPAAPNAASWFNQDVTVQLSATDPGSPAAGVKEIHYTLNGTETAVQGASASLVVAREQVNNLTFWAVDNNGNIESPVTAAVVRLDKTAPVSTISPASASSWVTTNQVTLSGSDATSDVASLSYRIDNQAAAIYAGPFTLADGMHTVTYHGVDVAGNVEADKSATLNVDTTKPTATVTPGSGAVTNSVTISGSDVTSGLARLEYQLDGAGTWTTGTTVSWAAGTGAHTVRYRAVDNAGIVGDVATATYTAASAAPATPVIASCSVSSGNSATSITWTEATDPASFEVRYLNNTNPSQSFAGTLRSGTLSAALNNTAGEFWLVAIGPGGTSTSSNHVTYSGNGGQRTCTVK